MIFVAVTMMRQFLALAGYQSGQLYELEEGADISALLKKLTGIYGSRLKDALLDENMNLKKGVSMYLNGAPVLGVRALSTKFRNRDSLVIYPPVTGGNPPGF